MAPVESAQPTRSRQLPPMQCATCGNDNIPEARFCAQCGSPLAAIAAVASTPTPSASLSPPTPSAQAEQAVPSAVATEFAGFWRRFGGLLIDSVILWLFLGILGTLLRFISVGMAFLTNPFVITLLLSWLYCWLFVGLKGQTPGKMVVGVKVVDGAGGVPGLRRAALRELLGKPISTLVFFLGLLWIAWDPRRQGWHDKLATTYVIRRTPGR